MRFGVDKARERRTLSSNGPFSQTQINFSVKFYIYIKVTFKLQSNSCRSYLWICPGVVQVFALAAQSYSTSSSRVSNLTLEVKSHG